MPQSLHRTLNIKTLLALRHYTIIVGKSILMWDFLWERVGGGDGSSGEILYSLYRASFSNNKNPGCISHWLKSCLVIDSFCTILNCRGEYNVDIVHVIWPYLILIYCHLLNLLWVSFQLQPSKWMSKRRRSQGMYLYSKSLAVCYWR